MPRTFYSVYLDGGMLAHELYPVGFGAAADRSARTRAAAARTVSPALLERLRAQNAGLPPSPARDKNIDALQGRCAAVITGQQVGLFLGPLYTLYKAATAIATARMLEAESGVRCVPIFWLQTEDHDFLEIAGCSIPRSDGELARLQLVAGDDVPARASVAQRKLGPDVDAALAALDETLGDLPHAQAVSALLRRHYCAGATWCRAFAGVLAQLFSDEGLIIFDPREEVVARLSAPIIRRALVEHEAIDAALATRGDALAAAGLGEQVRARAGMPLPFFHLDDKCGPRQRLRLQGDRFLVEGSDKSFSERELLAILETEPLRFSTSALLRPIVQDSLLPTAAYVGGPAEVNYFAQLAPLYAVYSLPPPLLVPRARFRLVPPTTRKLLDTLKLTPADVEQPRETLAAKIAPASAASDTNANAASDTNANSDGNMEAPGRAWIAELERKLDALAAGTHARDPKLMRAVERTRATVVRAVGRLERRYVHLLLERDRVLAARIDRLQQWLYPDHQPQERVHSLLHWAARLGPRALVDAIFAALDPLHPQPRDLDL